MKTRLVVLTGTIFLLGVCRLCFGFFPSLTSADQQRGDRLFDVALVLSASGCLYLLTRKQFADKTSAGMDPIQLYSPDLIPADEVLENMPVGLLITSEEGRIEYANQFCFKLFDGKNGKLIGSHISDAIAIPWQDVQQIQLPSHISLSMKIPSTTPAHPACELTVGVVIDSRKRRHYLVNVQDTSERRRLEQLKRQFVAMVAHDLRAPLSNIMLTLSLVNQGIFGTVLDSVRDELQECETQASRLVEITNLLLDVERWKSGTMELKLEACVTRELIDIALRSLESVAAENDVRLIDKTLRSTMLFCDHDALIRVLVNLVSNAIKVSTKGASVEVFCEPSADSVKFSVRDQGPGIEPEKQQGLFEPFVQVEQNPAGTGLGLAICKQIVEKHGGSVGLESKPGTGAIFWFTLPTKLGDNLVDVLSTMVIRDSSP